MKSYIKKSLLIATTAMLVNPMAIASADVGDGLGVELILNEKFKGTPNASLYTVSHYNNVKSANKVYKGNNLTIELFADKVVYETYDNSKNANVVVRRPTARVCIYCLTRSVAFRLASLEYP